MTDDQASRMLSFVGKSLKEIEAIFSLEGETLDDTFRNYVFFCSTVIARILSNSEMPIESVNEAYKVILEKSTAIDMEELVRMFRGQLPPPKGGGL